MTRATSYSRGLGCRVGFALRSCCVRTVGFAVIVAVVALAAGGSGRATASNSLAPGVYLDHALDLMQTNAVYTPTPGWKAVRAKAHNWWAVGATSPEGTYGAIRYVVEELRQAGDLHAGFYDPSQAKALDRLLRGSGTAPTPPPTVSLLEHRLGVISLPGVLSPPKSPSARRYARRALLRIARLGRNEHPCGWIIDLRNDTGGDIYPMFLAVGPILGNGRLIGFTAKRGRRVSISYRDGTLLNSTGANTVQALKVMPITPAGGTVQAPVKVMPIRPAPPVAVLTGPKTISAGEAVTVASHGRPNTRSFGLATAGAPNSPVIYHLADGAAAVVSVALDVDRQGHIYKHAIAPDVTSADAQAAAQKWLLSTTACTRTH
jgi:carboxyl-terminal processing protease